MSLIEDTYTSFMMDHAAGQHDAAMSVAANLHVLLSDQGAAMNDIWRMAAIEIASDRGAQGSDDSIGPACDVISKGYEQIKWRRGFSGAHYAKSPVAGGKFMRLMPGKSVPGHGHKKLEVTVVLEGQLTDGTGGIYNKGDIVFGVPGVRHKPAAHGDRPCICFVAKA